MQKVTVATIARRMAQTCCVCDQWRGQVAMLQNMVVGWNFDQLAALIIRCGGDADRAYNEAMTSGGPSASVRAMVADKAHLRECKKCTHLLVPPAHVPTPTSDRNAATGFMQKCEFVRHKNTRIGGMVPDFPGVRAEVVAAQPRTAARELENAVQCENRIVAVNLAAHVNPSWAVLRAQLAGAVGVIFISDREDPLDLEGNEGGEDEPPHSLLDTIKIPSVSIGRSSASSLGSLSAGDSPRQVIMAFGTKPTLQETATTKQPVVSSAEEQQEPLATPLAPTDEHSSTLRAAHDRYLSTCGSQDALVSPSSVLCGACEQSLAENGLIAQQTATMGAAASGTAHQSLFEDIIGPPDKPLDSDMDVWLRAIDVATIDIRMELEEQMPLKTMLEQLRDGRDSDVRVFLAANDVKIPDRPPPRSRMRSYNTKLECLR